MMYAPTIALWFHLALVWFYLSLEVSRAFWMLFVAAALSFVLEANSEYRRRREMRC